MVEAGLWNDVEVNISWHPGANTEADVQSSLALIDFKVEFFGQAAHASADPWNGRSASDALELYTTGINYYREHVKPTVRRYKAKAVGSLFLQIPLEDMLVGALLPVQVFYIGRWSAKSLVLPTEVWRDSRRKINHGT